MAHLEGEGMDISDLPIIDYSAKLAANQKETNPKAGLTKPQSKQYDLVRRIIKQHMTLSDIPGFNTKIKGKHYISVEMVEGATRELSAMNLWKNSEINIDGIKFMARLSANPDSENVEVLLSPGDHENTTMIPVEFVNIVAEKA